MPVTWIEHKGKKIIHSDYRGYYTQEEMLANLDQLQKVIKETEGNVLILADIRDCNVNSKFMNEIKRVGKELLAARAEKTAILGITGVRKILVRTYNVFSGDEILAFDDEEKAKEYLVK